MNRLLASLLQPRIFLGLVLILSVGGVLIYGALTGHLEIWVAYLDSDTLSIVLGESRISIYLLLKATLIIIALLWLTGVVSHYANHRIRAIPGLRKGNKALLSKVIQIAIYFSALLLGAHALGVNIAALAIVGGTVGIGIGFGLQKITSNFISGMILLFEKSIEEDDLVELNGGVLGYVRQIYARYTLIETIDGKDVMVPNEEFIIQQVTNLSYSNTRGRIEVAVGVSYDSDAELAMEIMLDAAASHARCLTEPKPSCYMVEFADSSVNLVLYFWIADVTQDRWGPRSDVMREIRRRFHESNITIPFPQRDVHLINDQGVQPQPADRP